MLPTGVTTTNLLERSLFPYGSGPAFTVTGSLNLKVRRPGSLSLGLTSTQNTDSQPHCN